MFYQLRLLLVIEILLRTLINKSSLCDFNKKLRYMELFLTNLLNIGMGVHGAFLNFPIAKGVLAVVANISYKKHWSDDDSRLCIPRVEKWLQLRLLSWNYSYVSTFSCIASIAWRKKLIGTSESNPNSLCY